MKIELEIPDLEVVTEATEYEVSSGSKTMIVKKYDSGWYVSGSKGYTGERMGSVEDALTYARQQVRQAHTQQLMEVQLSRKLKEVGV